MIIFVWVFSKDANFIIFSDDFFYREIWTYFVELLELKSKFQ